MKISRRRFLRLSIGAGLLASSGYVLKVLYWPSNITSREAGTFSAFLDTLIPADESPGAVQLGVPGLLLSRSSKERKYRILLKRGCNWLDRRAREQGADGFASLSEGKRQQILHVAKSEAEDSLPRGFFERVRHDAFFHYYAHPDSWRGFGFSRPPQPKGYPDYTLPPKIPPA